MRVIVVMPDGTVSWREVSGFSECKEILAGGYIEALPLGEDFRVYIDEDGKAKQLPANRVATSVVRRMLSVIGRTLLPGDFICGTAIFVGVRVGDDGLEETDFPVEQERRYF